MDNLTSLFIEYTASEKKTQQTQLTYLTRIEFLTEWINEKQIPYFEVTPVNAQEFKEWLKKKTWKPRTINLTLIIAGTFYSWLKKMGKITENPFKGVGNIKTKKALPNPFSAEEIGLIFQKVKNKENKIAILLMAYFGCRSAEVLRVRKEHFEYEEEKLRLKIHGKGAKERFSYCTSQSAQALLEDHMKKKGNNTLLYPKKKRSLLKMADRLKKYIPDYHNHRLRHTFATNLAKKGCSIELISKLLGHADIKTTQIYAQFVPTAKNIPWVD